MSDTKASVPETSTTKPRMISEEDNHNHQAETPEERIDHSIAGQSNHPDIRHNQVAGYLTEDATTHPKPGITEQNTRYPTPERGSPAPHATSSLIRGLAGSPLAQLGHEPRVGRKGAQSYLGPVAFRGGSPTQRSPYPSNSKAAGPLAGLHFRTKSLAELHQERFEKAEAAHAERVLTAKQNVLGRRLDIAGLRRHQLSVAAAMQQREVQLMVRRSSQEATPPRTGGSPTAKGGAALVRQVQVADHLRKQKAYSRVLVDKIDVRSDPATIRRWESARQRELFGSQYLEKVRAKKAEALKRYEPDRYLHQAIEVGRSAASLPRLHNGASVTSLQPLPSEEEAPKYRSYKEMLDALVDAKKVADANRSNKELNYYERLARADRYRKQTRVVSKTPGLTNSESRGGLCIVSPRPSSPVFVVGLLRTEGSRVLYCFDTGLSDDIQSLSVRFSRNPSDELLQKFLSVDAAVYEQISMQRAKDRFLPKVHRTAVSGVGLPNPHRHDTVRLLSDAIHSKLKVLQSLSPS